MKEQDVFLTLLLNNTILERMKCNKEEKEKLIEIIELFGEMTERSRQVGYNSMKLDYFNKINNDFFKAAIILRIDTNSSEYMIQSLLPFVLASDQSGKDFTEKLLILYGITRLTQGENSILLKLALYNFIGETKGYEELVSLENI